MRLSSFARCLVAVLAASVAAPAAADDLASLLPNLFDQRIILADPPPGFPSHAAHFIDEEDRLRDTGRLINESLGTQLATFPLGSSAGGFTYAYDPALGVFNRTSESFGPIYAERVQSLGRGKWNSGFSYQEASYDQLNGIELDGGDLAFPLFHEDTNHDGSPTTLFFEGDVIDATSRIQLDTATAVFFVSYGATDRLDLSIAVPVLDVELEAEAELNINRIATGTASIHRFRNGTTRESYFASGSASGVGDVVLRGKYRLTGDAGSGLAAALDVRLPTGDEQDLLGTGATQGKLLLVGSTTLGSFSPHGNVGYTVSSGGNDLGGDLPDEINYAAGFDWAAHPRLTFAADVVGRVLRDARTIESVDRTVQFTTMTGGPVQTTQVRDLEFGEDDLNLVLGSFGLRWNPGGNFLISLNGIVAIGDDGLQDDGIIPLFGIDYSF
jgi:hypothetical protein